MLPTPVRDTLESAPKAIRGGLLLHHPVWGSGSSPAKSYYKNPQESASQVIFRPKTAKPGFLGCLLREIIACNLDARRQAVKTGRISRNTPGV
jgi:hypothetical protein